MRVSHGESATALIRHTKITVLNKMQLFPVQVMFRKDKKRKEKEEGNAIWWHLVIIDQMT